MWTIPSNYTILLQYFFLSDMVSCTKALTLFKKLFTEFCKCLQSTGIILDETIDYVTVQLEVTQILPNPKHTFHYFFKWIFPWPFQNLMEAYMGSSGSVCFLANETKKLSKSVLFAVENNMKVMCVVATQTWFQGLCTLRYWEWFVHASIWLPGCYGS